MSKPLTFTNTRILAACPEQIHNAFADAEILAQWWGPEGFSSVIHELAFEPGGILKMDMHGPDGTIYPNTYYFESIAPDRIVFLHPQEPHAFTAEVLLEPVDGKTKLTWNQTFENPDEFERASAFGPACNEQLFDRLAMQLAIHFPGELNLVLHRIIDAPAEKVYQGLDRSGNDREMVHTGPVENRFRKARCPPRRQLVHHDAGSGRNRDAEPRRLPRSRSRTSASSSPTPTPTHGSLPPNPSRPST